MFRRLETLSVCLLCDRNLILDSPQYEREDDELSVVNPFDWTYTTHYHGTTSVSKSFEETEDEIDIEMLKRPDPIHFYETIPLFEDELGDNGAAQLNVRVVRFFRDTNVACLESDAKMFLDSSKILSQSGQGCCQSD